jgi:transposase
MKHFRISLSSRTLEKLKEKREAAEKLNDLRLYKKISAIIAVSEQASFSQVAQIFEVSIESVRIWVRDYIQIGMQSLNIIKSKGRPAKLTKKQRGELEDIIEAGPEKAGYPGQCWRSPMIQDLIFRKYGVLYSVFYIAELLKNIGFSFQKAKFESGHLNEWRRKEWLWKTWPEILRKATRIGAYILFGDEASFPQWGTLGYTWAKKGVTPVIKTSGNRKGYKVFGLIEYFTGKFFCQAQEKRLDSASYIHFLETVLEKSRRHIFLIQDGSGYHTSTAVDRFFQDNSDRMTVTQLPAYSPDYNPIEKLWKKIKEKGTHLHYFPTFEALKDKVDFMLGLFEEECKEVLALFGFYQELAS